MVPWSFRAPAPPIESQSGLSPTFSVIIAVYNAAAYLPQAIESCLVQSMQALEIIVVDDGSTDDFDRAIAPFLDQVLVLRQANRGESSAKNAAVLAASGDYVVILDADDVAFSDRIEALNAFAIERPDLDIITHDDVLTQDGEFLRNFFNETHTFPVHKQREEILKRCFIVNPAVKRSAWIENRGYDENLRIGADWDLWIRMILSGSVAGAVVEPLVEYRQWGGNLTSDRLASFASRVALFSKTQLRDDLSASERIVLENSLVDVQRRLAWEAVIAADPSARSALSAVLRNSRQSLRTRTRAGVALVTPSALRKWMFARRDEVRETK